MFRPNDQDVERMGQIISDINLHKSPAFIKSLYIGRHCQTHHIIDVCPIFPTPIAQSHEDLDFFAWSVGISQYSETYVNLKCNRVVLNHAQLEKTGKQEEGHPEFNYVVVHYDQDEKDENDSNMILHYRNKALAAMVGVKHMIWTGDLFVVKTSALDGELLDVHSDDIGEITLLLDAALLSGRMA